MKKCGIWLALTLALGSLGCANTGTGSEKTLLDGTFCISDLLLIDNDTISFSRRLPQSFFYMTFEEPRVFGSGLLALEYSKYLNNEETATDTAYLWGKRDVAITDTSVQVTITELPFWGIFFVRRGNPADMLLLDLAPGAEGGWIERIREPNSWKLDKKWNSFTLDYKDWWSSFYVRFDKDGGVCKAKTR